MKKISELEILCEAHTSLLAKWAKEKDRADKGSEIAALRASQLWEKLEDLHGRIVAIEKEGAPRQAGIPIPSKPCDCCGKRVLPLISVDAERFATEEFPAMQVCEECCRG